MHGASRSRRTGTSAGTTREAGAWTSRAAGETRARTLKNRTARRSTWRRRGRGIGRTWSGLRHDHAARRGCRWARRRCRSGDRLGCSDRDRFRSGRHWWRRCHGGYRGRLRNGCGAHNHRCCRCGAGDGWRRNGDSRRARRGRTSSHGGGGSDDVRSLPWQGNDAARRVGGLCRNLRCRGERWLNRRGWRHGCGRRRCDKGSLNRRCAWSRSHDGSIHSRTHGNGRSRGSWDGSTNHWRRYRKCWAGVAGRRSRRGRSYRNGGARWWRVLRGGFGLFALKNRLQRVTGLRHLRKVEAGRCGDRPRGGSLASATLEISADFLRLIFFDGAGVRLFFGDANRNQSIQDRLALDFQFSCKIVDSNFAHLSFVCFSYVSAGHGSPIEENRAERRGARFDRVVSIA